MPAVVIYKGRTTKLPVSLDFDVSADTITSQIRTEAKPTSELIATWTVEFLTDGTDGKLILTLDNSITALITKHAGYMDLKRVTNGEPVAVFADPIDVLFKETVTV
jgi:hypothetical protein